MTEWTPNPAFKERTDEEILERIKAIEESKEDPIFSGFTVADLLRFLPYEAMLPFLASAPESPETYIPHARTEQNLRGIILEYLPFAWDKANDCRGLSAGRSLRHFAAWVWMLGNDELAAELSGDWNLYGKPLLVKVSELVGYNWRAADDGLWRDDEDHPGISADEALKN